MDALKVDLSCLTIGDLVLFDSLRTRQASQAELVAFLDRVVVGGASQLPLTRLGDVMTAIQESVATLGNPVDGQGKA
jgi:hypothetical protein